MPNIPLPQRNADGSYTTSPAGMMIDADGANGQTGGVPVYAPKGFKPDPLDFLANAGGPGNWVGVVLGCKATIEDTKTGKILKAAGVLDFGPRAKLGEASIACAQFFGIPSS